MKDAEMKITFATPDSVPNKRKKRQRISIVSESEEKDSRLQYEKDYAEGFIKKLSEKLDEHSFTKLISALQDFENRSLTFGELQDQVETILKLHEDLRWEFLGFLEPYQTLESGKLMEFFRISDMKEFIQKLMLHFKKQPHLMKKIVDKLCYLSENEQLQLDTIEENIASFLPKNSDLTQQFLKLFHCEKPSERYFVGGDVWEEFTLDNELTEEETLDASHLNEGTNLESKSCIYGCKTNKNVSACVICDVKYINGRMYIANGKILCPANIIFDSLDEKENTKRLCGTNDYYIPSTSRPTKVHKRADSGSKEAEGGLSPFILGTESEEEIGENEVQPRNKKRKAPRGLKIRFKSDKKKCLANRFPNDQVQTDDTAPSNDDGSCDDTSKEDNDYNSCDESVLQRSNSEHNSSLPAKEIVALNDMELNISSNMQSSSRLVQDGQIISKNRQNVNLI